MNQARSRHPKSPASGRVHPPTLEVHLLGLVDFESAAQLQERLVYEIGGRNDSQGALLLCEHPPVISIGREGSRSQVLVEQGELNACEVDVHWIGRGGGALMHAPGQLAVYAVLPLNRLGLTVSEYRRRMEETLLTACRAARVPAKRDPGLPGIWSRGGQVGFLGAAIKNWVTYHGAFLNVSADHGLLRMVAPHGGGQTVTSLQAQRNGLIPMPRIRESVIRQFTTSFAYNRWHIYTGHPLLSRTTRRVCLHA